MLTVEYLLDLDIKQETDIQTPTIMRGDSAVLKFRVHDNNSNEPLKKFDKAEVTLVMPSGITITENCVKQEFRGIDIARFEFKKIHSIEIGIYQIYLTIYQGGDRVSVPPFPVKIDDNVSQDDYEFLEIIKGLEDQLKGLEDVINNGVPLSSINVANGVVGLDASKKIPPVLFLDYFENHIATKMYKDGAHGFKLDENKKPWVLVDGDWKEAKYSETPMGAGSPMPIPTIRVQNGYAIVTFAEPVKLSLRKWTFGIQNSAWFKTNGTIASTNTFAVSQVGEHTFYYQLEDGRENTVAFQVSKEGLDTGISKPIEEFKDGDLIRFGNLEWIIINSKERLLLSRFPVSQSVFSANGNAKFEPSNPNSTLAYWLNNTFYNAFSSSEKEKILLKSWNTGADNNIQESMTTASVGVLDYYQVRIYFDILQKSIQNGGFFLSTEVQNYSDKIWYLNNVGGQPSAETVSKDTFTGNARPSIYLASGTLVEPIIEDENIPLSQLENGDIVKFSNKRWRVLDKANGLIIYDDIPIYRGSLNIWDDFLNSSFYVGLSGQSKSFIQPQDWDISKANETPMTNKITAFVGLMSLSMFNTYKASLSHLIGSRMFWASNNGNLDGLQVAINTTDGYFGNYVQVSNSFDYQVIPVIKVSQNATFGKLKEETVELSTIQKGQQVWLGNYPWIKGNNNDLILNYNYRMDVQPVKVPFSGDSSSNYFSMEANRQGTTRNASKDVNSKFLLERLFYRVYASLTDKEFNIGYVDNPTSQKGFFKAGLVGTKTWTDDYQNSLSKLIVEEDFWLLNPLNANEAYYVSAIDRRAKTGAVDTIEKITKPVLRLEPTTQVQLYKKDEGKYAYIPDPVVRRAINKLLGKGDVITEITIAEMETITFFDTIDLMTATDLTGVELLVNCTWIRAAHSSSNFNITDFSPLNKLGKNPKMKRFSIYGVPEGDPSLAVYSQLKAQYPYLTEGGVYTNGHEKVLISQAELMGIPNGVYLNLDEFYTASSSNGTYISLKARARGMNPITHIKPWNSTTYVPLPEPTWDFVTNRYQDDWKEIPVYFDGTETKLYTLGLKDGDGNEEIFYYKVDPLYNYYWGGRDKKPVLSKSRQGGQNQTVVTLPATVDGLTIEGFGSMLERPFWSASNVTTLTIPVTYKYIGQTFNNASKLEKVYVHNDSIKYLDESYVFGKNFDSAVVTLYGRQGSSTQKLHQFKTSPDFNIPQGIKDKYKFALLQ